MTNLIKNKIFKIVVIVTAILIFFGVLFGFIVTNKIKEQEKKAISQAETIIKEKWEFVSKNIINNKEFEQDFIFNYKDVRNPELFYLYQKSKEPKYYEFIVFKIDNNNFLDFKLKGNSKKITIENKSFEEYKSVLKNNKFYDSNYKDQFSTFSDIVEEPTFEQLEKNKQVEINNANTEKRVEEARKIPLEIRISRFRAGVYNYEKCRKGEFDFKTGGKDYIIEKGKYPDVYNSDIIITKQDCDEKFTIERYESSKEVVKNYEEKGTDPLGSN